MQTNTATATPKDSAKASAPKKKASKARAKTAKQPKKTKAGKSAAKKTATKKAKPKRVSAIDAAAQVLAKADKPMSAKDLISTMAEQGLWSSPNGKTPHATLYAAIFREIAKKGAEARFEQVDRGLFAIRA